MHGVYFHMVAAELAAANGYVVVAYIFSVNEMFDRPGMMP